MKLSLPPSQRWQAARSKSLDCFRDVLCLLRHSELSEKAYLPRMSPVFRAGQLLSRMFAHTRRPVRTPGLKVAPATHGRVCEADPRLVGSLAGLRRIVRECAHPRQTHNINQALVVISAYDFIWSRPAEILKPVADEISSLGRRSLVVPTDVASTSDVENLIQTTVEEFGDIGILVNNAGLDAPSSLGEGLADEEAPGFLDVPYDHWDKVVDINLNGVARCCLAAGARRLVPRTRMESGLAVLERTF